MLRGTPALTPTVPRVLFFLKCALASSKLTTAKISLGYKSVSQILIILSC